MGASVVAIDFNSQLLDELKTNATGHNAKIQIIQDDLVNFKKFTLQPDLILCCGDTIAHLESFDVLHQFLTDCYQSLSEGGTLYLTFRDYSNELKDQERFILVKADETRILSCFLEYQKDRVTVFDTLYEKQNHSWQQKISSYSKIRISVSYMEEILKKLNFNIVIKETGRMNTLIAAK